MLSRISLITLLVLTTTSFSLAQTREEKVRRDREHVESTGYWIYNDLKQGFAQARATKKPMLVVLRCIPCEECVKLDENLMEKDEKLKPLMDQFVRVRLISTNGLDLSLFQYDYDQSFAVFLLNADRTVYGRFGTRSHHTLWSEDVSIEALQKAMQRALKLHSNFDEIKSSLTGKQGNKPDVATPEKYPSLAGKYRSKINAKKDVVKSCIHCHQIGDAQREFFLKKDHSIPEQILFQYPHPKILGLILNPKENATVKEVFTNSIAESSGFQKGDQIQFLEGQPLLSIADVQWVLHHAKSKDQLSAVIDRNGEKVNITVSLPEGWKRQDDLSWRVSSWPLRRMVLGGAVLKETTGAQRKILGITLNSKLMALEIRHLGRYGAHAVARRAGFKKGDIITSYNGRKDLQRETDLLAYGVNEIKIGQSIEVIVYRDSKRLRLKLPRQK